MAERDWERELAEIVGRPASGPQTLTVAQPPEAPPEPGPVKNGDTLDLRLGAPSATPSEEWLELRLERIGASLLRLVDQRLTSLSDDLRRQTTGTASTLRTHALDTETRLDALEDVMEALATRLLAVDAMLESVRAQLHEVRSALFR